MGRASLRREVKRLERLVLMAHDALHAGDTDAVHEYLHAAMRCNEPPEGVRAKVRRLAAGLSFDEAFRSLCRELDVTAMYLHAVERPAEGGFVSLSVQSGGSDWMCQRFGPGIRNVVASVLRSVASGAGGEVTHG